MSETLGALSADAERLFFRLTLVADDYGRFTANPAIVYGRCLAVVEGATPKKTEGWLSELAAAGSIVFYEVEGRRYLHFPKWEKYQRGFRGKPKFPEPPRLAATCGNSPRDAALIEIESVIEIESDLRPTDSGELDAPLDEASLSKPEAEQPLRPEDLVEAWNEHLAPEGFSRVMDLSATRRRKALARLHEHPDPAWWEAVIGNIRGSPFLRGLSKPRKPDEKPFKANFDWIIENDTNAVKVYEGRYDNG